MGDSMTLHRAVLIECCRKCPNYNTAEQFCLKLNIKIALGKAKQVYPGCPLDVVKLIRKEK